MPWHRYLVDADIVGDARLGSVTADICLNGSSFGLQSEGLRLIFLCGVRAGAQIDQGPNGRVPSERQLLCGREDIYRATRQLGAAGVQEHSLGEIELAGDALFGFWGELPPKRHLDNGQRVSLESLPREDVQGHIADTCVWMSSKHDDQAGRNGMPDDLVMLLTGNYLYVVDGTALALAVIWYLAHYSVRYLSFIPY